MISTGVKKNNIHKMYFEVSIPISRSFYFTPRKYWLITQEAMAPSRYDWKIVDWDVKPQHNQPTNQEFLSQNSVCHNGQKTE